MSRLLLDTHIVLWWLQKSHRLRDTVIETIDNAQEVYFSSLSVMEIELKRHRLGSLPDDYLDLIRNTGFQELRFSATHARAMETASEIADPFDRALVSQAIAQSALLVTSDRALIESVPERVLAN